jgi:hypothetical protein
MGIKARVFHPLENVTLDDLVPQNHFHRHLERTLDRSFVRDLVCPLYAAAGRPSINPVVFFKLQLVRFFEGLRSERQLEQWTLKGHRGSTFRFLLTHLARNPQRSACSPTHVEDGDDRLLLELFNTQAHSR